MPTINKVDKQTFIDQTNAIANAINTNQPILWKDGVMYQRIMYIHGEKFKGASYENCDELEEVYSDIPNNSTGAVFTRCTKLVKADLGSVDNIGSNFFSNCSKLEILVLRNTSMVTLSSTGAFGNTPFRDTSGNGGKVYVPQALISTYEADNKWSALENCTFAAIEGSDYE